MIESLQWHLVSERMPDADETVLVWYVCRDGAVDWCAGYFDGEQWRDDDDCPIDDATVTHWAQPEGPQ